LALIIIIALVALWIWREMRPLVYDGYAAGGRVFSNRNEVTYVGSPPCADRVRAGAGCGEGFNMARKSKFFPMNGTTFFGADGMMEHVTDPNECRKIGTKPQFMMIQDGKPVYRCVRFGEPLATRR